jgi:hypothetical protein
MSLKRPTAFFSLFDRTIFLREMSEIDRLVPIVAETTQILNCRDFPLNSRAQISDGSGRRFFVVRRKNLRLEFNALRSLKNIEWE